MLDSPNDEEILNVFRVRHPKEETLTTEDLAETLSCKQRTAQNYVKSLESEGRLVLESEGKPNHWRLAESEPFEPVYKEEVAKAIRLGNKASKLGTDLFVFGIGFLATAGLFTSNYIVADSLGIRLPLVTTGTVSVASLIGALGAILFVLAFLATTIGILVPRLVKWRVNEPVPEER